MKKPLVSIIIINWNGGQILLNCLKSLSKINYPNWELILVDNGSRDGSENFINKVKLKNIKNIIIKNSQNLGFAPANNQGLKKSSGEYILLLNNDTLVPENFLSIMIDKMESDSTIGVIQPKIYMMDNHQLLDNAGSYLTKIGFLEHWGFMQKDRPEFNQEREILSAKGACMLIRVKVTEGLGLFDEKFFSYFEESDFCWRVWLAGFRVLFFPKTYIYHKLGFTIRRLNVANINYHAYKNRIRSLIKNLQLNNLVVILAAHLVISFVIAIAFLIKLKPKNSLMILKAILWNLIYLGDTVEERAKIQKLREVTDNDLFEKLMHPINWSQYLEDFKRIEQDIKRKPGKFQELML